VHLLCFAGSPTSAAAVLGKGVRVLPPIMEEPMHYHARVQVNRAFTKAEAVGGETALNVKDNVIEIQTTDPHEVLVVHL